MDDFLWFAVISVLLVCLGSVLIRLGLAIWKKQKMELIIRYHCDRVREENRAAFCTLSGIGVLVMGIGMILSGICVLLTPSPLALLPLAAGLTAGITLLIFAQIRYNHE